MLNLVRIVCIWILGIDLMNTSPNWFEDLMNNVHCANDFLLWLFREWSGKLLLYALFSHDNWIWCYMSFSWIVAMHENSLIYLVIGILVELRLQENYLLATIQKTKELFTSRACDYSTFMGFGYVLNFHPMAKKCHLFLVKVPSWCDQENCTYPSYPRNS